MSVCHNTIVVNGSQAICSADQDRSAHLQGMGYDCDAEQNGGLALI
jgi:hypothetical protein